MLFELKQENERLSEILVWKQEHEKELHTRIEKAVEYIQNNFDKTGECVSGSDLPYSYIEDLLNILQNGDDSQ